MRRKERGAHRAAISIGMTAALALSQTALPVAAMADQPGQAAPTRIVVDGVEMNLDAEQLSALLAEGGHTLETPEGDPYPIEDAGGVDPSGAVHGETAEADAKGGDVVTPNAPVEDGPGNETAYVPQNTGEDQDASGDINDNGEELAAGDGNSPVNVEGNTDGDQQEMETLGMGDSQGQTAMQAIVGIPGPLEDGSEPGSAEDGGESSGQTMGGSSGKAIGATAAEMKLAWKLLDAGWTPDMVAAALGNAHAESGGDPKSFCDMSGMFAYGHEIAAGIFQWTDAGASAGELSCAGFTGLAEYATSKGKAWDDADVQAEYFLQTWRESWQERQTMYDGVDGMADVDISLTAFDISDKADFDVDGTVDTRDADKDGDGIDDREDPAIERNVDGAITAYEEPVKTNGPTAMQSPAREGETEEQREIRQVAEQTFRFMAGYEGPNAAVAHFDVRVAHALAVYPLVKALSEDLTPGSRAAEVVAAAAEMLGGKYVWGGESPETGEFDCSGLTMWAYSRAGIAVDHYSETQREQADARLPVQDAKPGDILWMPGHVAIYAGGGKTIEARGKDYGIVVGDASRFSEALRWDAMDVQLPETAAAARAGR